MWCRGAGSETSVVLIETVFSDEKQPSANFGAFPEMSVKKKKNPTDAAELHLAFLITAASKDKPENESWCLIKEFFLSVGTQVVGLTPDVKGRLPAALTCNQEETTVMKLIIIKQEDVF